MYIHHPVDLLHSMVHQVVLHDKDAYLGLVREGDYVKIHTVDTELGRLPVPSILPVLRNNRVLRVRYEDVRYDDWVFILDTSIPTHCRPDIWPGELYEGTLHIRGEAKDEFEAYVYPRVVKVINKSCVHIPATVVETFSKSL